MVRRDAYGQDAGHEIVLLAVAQSEIEAQMWANSLRAADISVLVKPGGPGMGAWASTATFEHRLYVRRDQLDEARGLLGSARGERRVPRRRPLPRVNRRSPRKSG